jgi:hypothetical protein
MLRNAIPQVRVDHVVPAGEPVRGALAARFAEEAAGRARHADVLRGLLGKGRAVASKKSA